MRRVHRNLLLTAIGVVLALSGATLIAVAMAPRIAHRSLRWWQPLAVARLRSIRGRSVRPRIKLKR